MLEHHHDSPLPAMNCPKSSQAWFAGLSASPRRQRRGFKLRKTIRRYKCWSVPPAKSVGSNASSLFISGSIGWIMVDYSGLWWIMVGGSWWIMVDHLCWFPEITGLNILVRTQPSFEALRLHCLSLSVLRGTFVGSHQVIQRSLRKVWQLHTT